MRAAGCDVGDLADDGFIELLDHLGRRGEAVVVAIEEEKDGEADQESADETGEDVADDALVFDDRGGGRLTEAEDFLRRRTGANLVEGFKRCLVGGFVAFDVFLQRRIL